MAGSPCPVEVMKRVVAEMHMEQVSICYGMTETSPVSLQTRIEDDLEHRTATVGRVLPHLEVRSSTPPPGVTRPRGAAGELCTRGYSVMLGYWNEPDRTAEVIDAGRWMHTGDLAVMREDGYVEIVGRIKDMIIRGGENIYPREIEEFLYAHPKIRDVQVIGVPHERATARRSSPASSPATRRTRSRWRNCGSSARAGSPTTRSPAGSGSSTPSPMTVSGKVRKVELRETYGR